VIVDLHSHYPMHVIPEDEVRAEGAREAHHRLARCKAKAIHRLSRSFNYEGEGGQPGVRVESLKAGGVSIGLSVLFCPIDELWPRRGTKPPDPGWFDNLLDQMGVVERDVAKRPGIRIVDSLAAADRANAAGDVALIHCVEGGFALGSNGEAIAANVRTLRQRGVAYVTLAHLVFRGIATNAPAFPFLSDWWYGVLFPQRPGLGLSKLGKAAVRAMVRERILIDVSHMSPRAMRATFKLLDRLDRDRSVPVVASHAACRLPKHRRKYNLRDRTIKKIKERNGVIGLIVSAHNMCEPGDRRPQTFEESFAVIRRHIEHIRKLTGSLDHVAIGSDIDGYIKPALHGLGDASGLQKLEKALVAEYGKEAAKKICSCNARRVLEYWDHQ
jgi:microsomal dipeptidase-like Zn-dependent dipeptidase